MATLGPAPKRSGAATAGQRVDGIATWLETFAELLKTSERGKRLPAILQDLLDRVIRFYERPKELIRTLAYVNSDRQMRSERRGAVLAVLTCLIHHLDVVTLKVGIPTADGFVYHLTMQRIAERTGLTPRRVYRAMSDLRRAALVTVTRQFRKSEDGTVINRPAVRTVSRLFFDVLGLGDAYDRERQRAHLRQQQAHAQQRKAARPTRRDQANWKLELARALARVKTPRSSAAGSRVWDAPPAAADPPMPSDIRRE
ncbi:hypothetical protein WI25_28725 [Burkholderia cepacia]|nr:hypothetical protein WI25_28725 [Burkholderia cepacia]